MPLIRVPVNRFVIAAPFFDALSPAESVVRISV
jgi:hypothetical protein